MPEPIPMVIDVGGEIDVVLIPADLVAKAHDVADGAERELLLENIALLIARLGSDVALPAVHDWLDNSPDSLVSFPAKIRTALVEGTLL